MGDAVRKTEISYPWYRKPWAFIFTLAVVYLRKDFKCRQMVELLRAEEVLRR
jgi:hypothetical protein